MLLIVRCFIHVNNPRQSTETILIRLMLKIYLYIHLWKSTTNMGAFFYSFRISHYRQLDNKAAVLKYVQIFIFIPVPFDFMSLLKRVHSPSRNIIHFLLPYDFRMKYLQRQHQRRFKRRISQVIIKCRIKHKYCFTRPLWTLLVIPTFTCNLI